MSEVDLNGTDLSSFEEIIQLNHLKTLRRFSFPTFYTYVFLLYIRFEYRTLNTENRHGIIVAVLGPLFTNMV